MTKLTDIASASPRGVSQTEVTFEIDINDFVKVSV